MSDHILFQQKLLTSLLSQTTPSFVRRANFIDLQKSGLLTILTEEYREALSKLHEMNALFRDDTCVVPWWVDEATATVFQLTQTLPGCGRREFRELLQEIETWLLEEKLKSGAGSTKVRPAATDYSDVRVWYKRRNSDGLRLLIPEVEALVGRLRPGERLIFGGYANSYKTIIVEHITGNAIKDGNISVLFLSSSRTPGEVRSRIADRLIQSKHMTEMSGSTVADMAERVTVFGKDDMTESLSIHSLRRAIDDELSRSSGPVLLVVDSIDELSGILYPKARRRFDPIAAFVSLLEHVSKNVGERLTILATLRFPETTYLRLRKRVDDWEWSRRRAGYGFLDVANAITARKIASEQQLHMLSEWEKTSVHSELSPDYMALRKEHESQAELLDQIEHRLKNDSIDEWKNEYRSPKGDYLIGAFQDPPEIERFFHVCISLWAERATGPTRDVLVRVVKNRNESTMDDPCAVCFENETAAIQQFVLPDADDQACSIEELLGEGLV